VKPGAIVEQVARLLPAGDPQRPPPGPPAAAPFPVDAPTGPPPERARVYRQLPKQQAHLVIGFPGITLGDPDRLPLEVLSTILSGQGGRLFVELREKRGLAYRVSAFSIEGLDPGYFAVYVATSPDKLAVAEERILVELERIRERRVAPAELARARRYLAGSHDISLQRRSSLASSLAFNEVYGLGWDAHTRYARAMEEVTADDLVRVAQRFLDPERSVTAIVSPDAEPIATPRGAPAAIARAARA
jgi:zinc protease